MIGILTGEGGRFLLVDEDGTMEGEATEGGGLRYCYHHIDRTSRVASCAAGTRE